MDVEELLKCLEILGVHLHIKSDIQGAYLGVLEEVSIKIEIELLRKGMCGNGF